MRAIPKYCQATPQPAANVAGCLITRNLLIRSWVALLGLLVLHCLWDGEQIHAGEGKDAPVGIDFNTDIRPILSNRCFACHGPDEGTIEGGLRLDQFDLATRAGDSGLEAISPGDPESSELIRRVSTDDLGERMPPDGSGEPLTQAEIEKLQQWISQGARYAKHWSLEPIEPVSPLSKALRDSSVDDPDFSHWNHSPIDRLVWGKLKERDWIPTSRAHDRTLIRRLYLDLIGLPPSPEAVESFLSNTSPTAYEEQVDALLASPSFGEHWARKWLDLARYADSAGYADDPLRTIWAYRDWVVQAINQGMPYDQFTIEQIAGDLLPNPTDQQLVATAFHRNTPTNNEGGTNDEEFRNVAVVDRVNTTMSVWMGVTMACAQCHTHKYDPITIEEYFQVFALFNQTQDADRTDESPLLTYYSPEIKQRREEITREQALVRTELMTPTPEVTDQQSRWEKIIVQDASWIHSSPSRFNTRSGAMISMDDTSIATLSKRSETDRIELTWTVQETIPLERFSAIRLETNPIPMAADLGSGSVGLIENPENVTAPVQPVVSTTHNFVLTDITMEISGSQGAIEVPWKDVLADFSQTGFDAKDAVDDDPESGWAVASEHANPHELVLVPDWSAIVASSAAIGEPKDVTLRLSFDSRHKNHVLTRFRISGTDDLKAIEKFKVPGQIRSIVLKEPANRTSRERDELFEFFVSNAAVSRSPQRQRLSELERELSLLKPLTTVPIMQDLQPDSRRETYVQLRGNYLSHGDRVHPAFPGQYHAYQAPIERDAKDLDRLDLAHWIVQDDNPLTARVLANRYWEYLFGTGIVRTSEEFGSQGDLPTHPELLDFLAGQIIRDGWNTKRLLRMIVLSETYQQNSAMSSAEFERDPDNVYMSRGPRIRATAEVVRDSTLAAAGLLSNRMYGEPVRPFQPNLGLSAAFGGKTDWEASDGENRYRRGLYTQWRRSSPYPSMATFDAPNREVCTLKRDRTNTPLQALVTLNDPVFVESAQSLSRRVVLHELPGDSDQNQLRRIYLHVLGRDPSEREQESLLALKQEMEREFKNAPVEALKLSTEPIGPLPDHAETSSMAAWTLVCNVILNLDEFLMKP